MSELQRTMLKGRLPPTGPSRPMNPGKKSRLRDYNPAVWSDFFAEKEDVVIDENRKYRVYRTKKLEEPGPVLLLMHGGGYSGLTWAHFCVEICRMIQCQCLAFDFRGHGDTHTSDDDDLSADTLANDIADLLKKMYGENNIPSLYLIGHSMGGAIAVHFACKELILNIIGITVIDVVEGTALEALASMQSFLRSRPTYFKSIPNAIEWCVRSGQIRNLDSARVSMPGQIINCSTNKLAASELPLPDDEFEDGSSCTTTTKFTQPLSISEDDELAAETETETSPNSGANKSECFEFTKPTATEHDDDDHVKRYTWRTDLSKSEKYWVGWFSGLSEKYLGLHMPKQLLLASIDGLDKALTVGQMQGKFQMQVLARCGHAVHEDRPHEVAEVVSSYLIRNRISPAKGEFVYHMPTC